jgi:ROS/MUCR transcriptional regulator protein
MKKNQQRPRVGARKTVAKKTKQFPWPGTFTSRQEVEAYFGSEEIQCLLCGVWLKALAPNHLKNKHSMSAREYQSRYGLPFSRGLICETTRLKKSEAVPPEVREFASKLAPIASKVAAQSWPRTGPNRARFLQEEAVDRMLRRRGTRRWAAEDFDRILDELAAGSSVENLWPNSALPKRSLWYQYRKKNDKYDQKVRRTLAQMKRRNKNRPAQKAKSRSPNSEIATRAKGRVIKPRQPQVKRSFGCQSTHRSRLTLTRCKVLR